MNFQAVECFIKTNNETLTKRGYAFFIGGYIHDTQGLYVYKHKSGLLYKLTLLWFAELFFLSYTYMNFHFSKVI